MINHGHSLGNPSNLLTNKNRNFNQTIFTSPHGPLVAWEVPLPGKLWGILLSAVGGAFLVCHSGHGAVLRSIMTLDWRLV